MNSKSVEQVLEMQIRNYEKLLSFASQIRMALEKDGGKAEISDFIEKREETFSAIRKNDESLNKFSDGEQVQNSLLVKLQSLMQSVLDEDKKTAEIMSGVEGDVSSKIGNANLSSNAIKGYLSQKDRGRFGRFINLKN